MIFFKFTLKDEKTGDSFLRLRKKMTECLHDYSACKHNWSLFDTMYTLKPQGLRYANATLDSYGTSVRCKKCDEFVTKGC